MAVRYVTLTAGGYWDGHLEAQIHMPESVSVFEMEPSPPADSGLLDQFGKKLYRLVEKRPIGFAMPDVEQK